MPTYLLEIGTEELPADQVIEAQEKLKSLVSEALTQANVKFEQVETMGTPRRLACLVKGLAPMQSTIKKKIKGPPVKSSFDPSGKPMPAASGFAQKHGLTVDKLGREETGGVEYLIADLTIEGKSSSSVLAEIIPQTIVQLSGQRLMRWGSSELRFSRPIRWLVSLLDKEEVPIKLDTLSSGRITFGNRVLAPGQITISNPDEYVAKLREAKVLVQPVERKEFIEKQVTAAAGSLKGKARQLTGPLVDEVVNILEWPHAVIGTFSDEYLALPDTLIETIMVHHQRYFPVEDSAKKGLLPYFITVANNDRKEAEPVIKQGNERVIKARLADGKFFFFDDQKVKLTARRNELEQLTFQEGLGSYLKKAERIAKAGQWLSKALGLEAKYAVCLERALELCKLDLVCNLVRELPELQGYVGSWYAGNEGEPPEVVAAIASHYAPRSTDDPIPADLVGKFAALIDKLDHLVGLFAIGRRPSGSSDPYALRRNAQGVADILIDGLDGYAINILQLSELLLAEMKPMIGQRKGFDENKILNDLYEFLLLRIKANLQQKEIRREVIDACARSPQVLTDIPDLLARCRCLESLLKDQACFPLLRSAIRIGKILQTDSPEVVDPKLFDNEYETKLWQKFEAEFKAAANKNEYEKAVRTLLPLVSEIDLFFEKVMVNDPDKKKRDNRHGMLNRINKSFAVVGDFTKLSALLP
ncbi:MAG: glycine--tRNA ligase subunit beta [Candidatus Obscuribacterales bacterium]|nr:glycine--tRNA ligase subunit beta [Candidatus Obscuribacterales bacterium]